ncbi:condensation domain-containing protein [Motilimonas eburnea]|uniref:condensation domain-containing protein n=1 Tax=Motilimonas eburnea TaxID=1737488 RepID=UPI001E31FA01|nr:condensation domain-containing protein [Motilimonas eburnea]MCE2573054.1 hypothetical protein [Motilimonas eburnea]
MNQQTWQSLTQAQQAYWDEYLQHPDKGLSTVAHCLTLTGEMNVAKLIQAIDQALIEAQVLSLRFKRVANQTYPLQRVASEQPVKLEVNDLRDQQAPIACAEAAMRRDVAMPINLSQDAITRAQLYLIDEHTVIWYIRSHHIAVDGYSMQLLTQRSAHLYSCLLHQVTPQPSFKPLEVYLKESRDYSQSQRFSLDQAYWQRYLEQTELPLSDGAGALADTCAVVRELPDTLGQGLVAMAQKLMIGWSDLLTLLCAAYLYQSWGRDVTNKPLPVWLPFMNRMGNPCANMPALMVNTMPFLVVQQPDEPIEQWLKRAVGELRNHYRHGRYRVENKLSSGQYHVSPFINVLPFEGAEFHACHTTSKVMAGGVADGFNITFRSNRAAACMSLTVEAEERLFSRAEVERHADDLLHFLSQNPQSQSL